GNRVEKARPTAMHDDEQRAPGTPLVYDQRHNDYWAELPDGREVIVDGDEVTKALEESGQANLTAENWLAGEGVNDAVRVYCAVCGDVSTVPESCENGTSEGCACACHEDGIALSRHEVVSYE